MKRPKRSALPPPRPEDSERWPILRDWDAVRERADCPHCHGTGLAPGDGRTACGFCR